MKCQKDEKGHGTWQFDNAHDREEDTWDFDKHFENTEKKLRTNEHDCICNSDHCMGGKCLGRKEIPVNITGKKKITWLLVIAVIYSSSLHGIYLEQAEFKIRNALCQGWLDGNG